jgi:hypothetical protein
MNQDVPITDPPIEIWGPDGKVHYRRPPGHPDLAEALRRPGYSVSAAIRWLELTVDGLLDGKTEMDAVLTVKRGRFTLSRKADEGASPR